MPSPADYYVANNQSGRSVNPQPLVLLVLRLHVVVALLDMNITGIYSRLLQIKRDDKLEL